MHLLVLFAFMLSYGAASISATPVVNMTPLVVSEAETGANEAHLAKRNIGGVYICTGTNWSGKCGYAVQPLNTCIVLGSDWKNKISSFGPDSCTMCFAYDTNNCSLDNGFLWMFQNPGDATGGTKVINNAFNKRLGSFKCWRSPDC